MSLRERLLVSGSALALSAVLAGCATSNPGVNALGNFVGAMLVAEAGAPQQNVVVQQTPYSSVPAPQPKNEWQFFTATGFEDRNGDKFPQQEELRGVKNAFVVGETPHFIAYNLGIMFRSFTLDFYNEQGQLIKQQADAFPTTRNSLYVSLRGCPTGLFTASLYVDGNYTHTFNFSVHPAQP